jgi:hypothetical protein
VKTTSSAIKTKIERFSQIAEDLRAGGSFPVTRLTTLKSLCADRAACHAFALHIAKLAKEKMDARDKPDHIDPSRWLTFRQTVEKAIMDLEAALAQGIEQHRSRLLELRQELKSLQDTYENQRWGPVRIISNSETLVVEYAVECFLSMSQAPHWAYRVARTYAEEYDSRFGDGLVPKSAPMVEEIARFWKNWYLDRADKK